ncbi:HTH domain-containing protein [Halosimplex aquaticum]|uniref:HTH domain-containing protein n=1 Tax=Halosimplex aquaticum TaxID=3026162 RepID=A0ABD5Y4C2_9EURY|nr:HTH domain-containing protein [Halosimplex aquaticum]
MATATPGRRSVVLFVRSLSPTETPAAGHVARVRDLEDTGRVADASVAVWGREIELSARARRTRAGQCVLDRIADFRAWADERGVSMSPFFDARERSSAMTGEEFAALRLPVCCLAEYDGDELVHVAPYSTGDAICTVADRLDRLDRLDRGDGEGGSDRIEAVQALRGD